MSKTPNRAVIVTRFTPQQFDTVIAALRLWQRFQEMPEEQSMITPALLDIAEEHGDALSADEIDTLIERIN